MKGVLSLFIILWAAGTLWADDPGGRVSVADDILVKALSQKNKPYKYNARSANGFDCSGFIVYVFSGTFGNLPSNSAGFRDFGTPVVYLDDMKPGDLLLFATGRNKKEISHIALFLGQNTLIHAVSEGPHTGVILSDVREPYWKNQLVAIRRPVFPEGTITEEEAKIYALEYIGGSFRGTLKQSLPEGRGFYFFRNGDTYVGGFHQGMADGYGVLHGKNGSTIMGNFSSGQISEKASCLLADGTSMALKEILLRNPHVDLPVNGFQAAQKKDES